MKQYNITLSVTGGISVLAESEKEALRIINEMSQEHLRHHVNWCDIEATDIEEE